MVSQPLTQSPVLVLEDDHDTRVLAREVLESAGLVVVTACNGVEGLSVLPKITRPFLILLDIEMPLMSGWDFLAGIRKTPEFKEIPVVVVSSVDPEANPEVACWVRKPASGATLLAAVRSFLPRRAASE